MTEQELQEIWHFTRHISRKSKRRVEETFDLKFKVYKSNFLRVTESYIMTKKERIFFVHTYWDYKTYKSETMSKKYECGWDITDLDDALINELEKKNWDTTNLKKTFKEVQNHPEFKKAKRKAALSVVLNKII